MGKGSRHKRGGRQGREVKRLKKRSVHVSTLHNEHVLMKINTEGFIYSGCYSFVRLVGDKDVSAILQAVFAIGGSLCYKEHFKIDTAPIISFSTGVLFRVAQVYWLQVPLLSLSSFKVSGLINRSLSHCEVIFLKQSEKDLISVFYKQISSLPAIFVMRLFSNRYFWFLCLESDGCMCDCSCVLSSVPQSIYLFLCQHHAGFVTLALGSNLK